MSHHLTSPVWLIGTGGMGVAYANVLKAQGIDFVTIGRSHGACERFENEVGIRAIPDGVEAYAMSGAAIPAFAIVAVNIEELSNVCIFLLDKGVKHILLEKPAGLDQADIGRVAAAARQHDAHVFVAYNRRFYASTLAAKELIAQDGGVDSFTFEFTEWSHQIVTLNKTKCELGAWFLANSTHVIDLAFYLGGEPAKMNCYVKDGLSWYPAAAVFSGAGVSENNALFSYQANWRAPGRWSVEILTKKHRFIFKPMEKLQLQEIGSVAVNFVEIDDALDIQFKPGLYRQVDAFVSLRTQELLSIDQHLANCCIYRAIETGSSFPIL